jgi:hypothetical protein
VLCYTNVISDGVTGFVIIHLHPPSNN